MREIENKLKKIIFHNNEFYQNEFYIIFDKINNIGYLVVTCINNELKIIKTVINIKNLYSLLNKMFECHLFRKTDKEFNIIFFKGSKKSPSVIIKNRKIISYKNIIILK